MCRDPLVALRLGDDRQERRVTQRLEPGKGISDRLARGVEAGEVVLEEVDDVVLLGEGWNWNREPCESAMCQIQAAV